MTNYGTSAGIPPTEGLAPNPECLCFHPMAAMFCSFGHMLECHYPMSCEEAVCAHFLDQIDGEEEYGAEDEHE